MKQNFFEKFVLVFLIFSLILPEITFAENFEEISLEEINEYLQLPEKDAKNLLDSLVQNFKNQWIDIESSPDFIPEEGLVLLLLEKAIKRDIFTYFLIDIPFEVTEKIIKYAIKIGQIFISQDLAIIFDEIEKESVKRAVDYGTKKLLENEIRITPGTLTLQYLTFSGQKEVVFQYLVIYKPTDSKHGKVEIRFYSPTSIEPPKSTWAFPHEVSGNLPPFIVEVSGSLEKFKWVEKPVVKISFPESVPDLGISPLSFWDKNIIEPMRNESNEIKIVLNKFFRKSEQDAEKIKKWFENTLAEIRDKALHLGAQVISFTQFRKKENITGSEIETTKSELGKLKEEISYLEEKLKVEESLKKELKEKYESDLNEISNEVNDFTARLDTFGQQINEFNQKPSEESTKPKSEEAKTETESATFCQRKDGDLPKRNRIIFNEIAWMGTEISSNDEWIEIKNISGAEVDLAGWQILDKDGQIQIIFSSGEQFSANGFYLLERTDDNSVPNVLANKIYTGALNDTNETLYLFNKNCELEDEVSANPDWPAGDKSSKRAMERKDDLSWQTSANPGGTPKRENSSGYFFVSSSGGGTSTAGGSGGGGGGGSESSSPPPPPKFGIIINEIQIEGQTSKDEFVEIFNSLNEEVDLTSFSLKKKTSTGSESNLVSSDKFSGTISTGGYFLIVPQPKDDGTPNYQGEVPPDLFYSGKTYSIAANNTVLLYDSNNNLIDKVGFGQVQDFETSPFPQNPSKNQSLGRKWNEANQNYQDTDNNQEDFEIQPPTPKARNEELKSQSNLEVSPNAIEFLVDFGKNPKSQILTLDSDTILNWKASIEYSSPFEGVNWLRSIPNSGKTPSQILVSAFVSDLTPGEYQAFLNIESEAQNSPLKIPVNLRLIPTEFSASTDHLLISEVQLADNEFVELYNPTDIPTSTAGWFLSYFSASREWNNPTISWEFPTTTIEPKSYYLIGIFGYSDVDWVILGKTTGVPYAKGQLGNDKGAIGIFSCNPEIATSDTIALEEAIAQAKNCKIDALGWGETIVKEGEAANPDDSAGKSLGRKLGINQQGELNYIDTDNNQSDFEIQEISPKKLNFHSFSDLDKDGILDLFDEETVLDGEIPLDANEYEFKNLKILENSKLILNSDSSVEGFKGVKINAQNFILEEGSLISADGKGYPTNEGPGAGKVGRTGGGSCSGYNSISYGSGAGYGGIGGKGGYGSCGESVEGGISYGFLEIPLDLGSGGGGENGGRGGGGIIIDVVEKINLDGQISANGEDGKGGSYSNSGGGSGGGILISTNILEGTGKILANGGNGKADCCGGGGGGGRIAIYYNLMENFNGEIEAFGSQGYKSGGAGTIFLKSFEKDFGDLTIDNGNFEGFTNLERDLGFDNFKVLNLAHLYLPEKLSANYLEIERATLESETQTEIEANQINLNESSLIFLPEQEFLKIKVNNLVLQSGSKINSNLDIESEEVFLDSTSAILADGKGFSAGQGLGSGKVGQTGGGGCSGYNICWFGSGGGYGGIGGKGSYSSCGAVIDGGISFGDLKIPIDLGSGGGGDTAGAGGGAIQIEVTNKLTLSGQISANGEDGKVLGYGGSGGGSGGSIFIKTNVLEGSGQISANGGSGYSSLGGGGSGGRIAIYYDSKDNFTGAIQSFSGGSGFKPGGPGTIFLKSPTQTFGDLTIDNNNFDGATQFAENYIFDNLKVLNSSHLYLPENLTATNLEVGNSSILEVLNTATINANQFLISENSSLLGPSQIFITINSDNFSLQSESKIITNVEINAGDLSIDSTSAILANGKGYPGGQGPGAGKVQMTGGGSCSGYNYCSFGSGAGYGGQGGQGSYPSCHATVDGGLPYGNEEEPIDFGSGGGGDTEGAGGGVIQIAVLDNLTLDGQISANGGEGKVLGYGGSGGGSAGSIFIKTNILEGSGEILANGGKGYDNLGGGGSGGRIAIYSQTNNFQGIIQVEGGAAGYQAGQDGTIFP
jgi:hypothetical protein